MWSGFHLKTSVVEFLFKKVAALKARNFIKKKLQHRCFPVNITKFLRTPFFAEHLWWLFLHCTGNCFVQCWPRQTKTKLRRLSSYRNIALRSRAIIAQVIFLSNVLFFFSIGVFFHNYSRITGLPGEGEGISYLLTTTSTGFTDT